MKSNYRFDVLLVILVYTASSVINHTGFGIAAGVLAYLTANRWDRFAKANGRDAGELLKPYMLACIMMWAVARVAADLLALGHMLLESGAVGLAGVSVCAATSAVMLGAKGMSRYVNRNWGAQPQST